MGHYIIGRYVPYCGAAPTPADIFTRWNFDAPLLACLGFVLLLYFGFDRLSGGHGGRAWWRYACFGAGWAIGVLALVTPLCPLSVSLFSARVSEHMILACVSAPLVALGRPWKRLERLYGALAARPAGPRPAQPLLAAFAFTGTLWFWHAPVPYLATFQSDAGYWMMQITLYASALWFWSALFDRSGDRLANFVAAAFLVTGQMGLLGAVITFAGHPLYAPHLATTAAWGLTPLQDQQLGGVVMWIPAGAIFTLALIFSFVDVMRRADARSAAHVSRPVRPA